jgi:hypothetical protein
LKKFTKTLRFTPHRAANALILAGFLLQPHCSTRSAARDACLLPVTSSSTVSSQPFGSRLFYLRWVLATPTTFPDQHPFFAVDFLILFCVTTQEFLRQ